MTEPAGNTEIDIVPIGPEAAAVMAPIHAASFDEAWAEPALSRLLRADAARAFGAFTGYERRPLGFVLAFVAADEAEILSIAVAPTHRRSGIGAKLLRTLQKELSQEDVSQLFLEVAADNMAADGLYRRLGFIETGRRRGYYQRASGPAVDALSIASPQPADAGPQRHLQ
jgi:[ribosomal protein S18]-alanine N-acetyltransferase